MTKELNRLASAKKYGAALKHLLSLEKEEIQRLTGRLSIDSLLFNYFTKEKEYAESLEKELTEKFPIHFIKAVRTSQVFIDKERLASLKGLPVPEKLSVHIKIWENLQQIDENLWEVHILANLSKILHLDMDYVLSETLFWLENERYNANHQQKLSELAGVYSFFIKLYLYKTDKTINNEIINFHETFNRLLADKLKSEKKEVDTNIHHLLTGINNWINFDTNLLQAYCFDLNIDPKLENGVIYFNQTPEHYYKWHLDGKRYNKISFDYHLKAQDIIIKKMEHREIFIPGNTEEKQFLNVQGAIRLKKMELFLEDLNVSNYIHSGKKIKLPDIFNAVSGFSFNRFYRYENTIENLRQECSNWFENYGKILMYSIMNDIELFPYLLLSKNDYVDRTKKSTKSSPEVLSASFSFLSYEVKKKYEFNRFNIGYDVMNKPFIKVGNFFFCPLLFFANNDWFFAASQIAIKNLTKNAAERKKTATFMEFFLGDKFKKKGFTVKVFNDREANKVDGDVDIIVNDEKTTLFIQLKRTYFRIIPKDAYYESITSDKKASGQLNKAIAYFKQHNDIYELKNDPVKWIVSTSFEGINSDIDHCNKINYFDLLFALEKEEISSLENLVNYLEKDKNVVDFYNVASNDYETTTMYLQASGLPLELVEPKKYLVPTFADDNYNSDYNKLFNKARSFYQKNDMRAIKILKQCLFINPGDIEVYGSLGNCYANLKDLDNLKTAFEEALSIVPNEPYIKRNYALALIENYQYYDGILKLLELSKDYSYVGDLSIIFMTNFKNYEDKLTDEEKERIENKWNNL